MSQIENNNPVKNRKSSPFAFAALFVLDILIVSWLCTALNLQSVVVSGRSSIIRVLDSILAHMRVDSRNRQANAPEESDNGTVLGVHTPRETSNISTSTVATSTSEVTTSAPPQVDASFIINVNLSQFSPDPTVKSITEDQNYYYVEYTISSIKIQDDKWQAVTDTETLKVDKLALNGGDLGMYIAKQLGEVVDFELSRLKEVQEKERKLALANQNLLSVDYTSLVGRSLDISSRSFLGYSPRAKILPDIPVTIIVPKTKEKEKKPDEASTTLEILLPPTEPVVEPTASSSATTTPETPSQEATTTPEVTPPTEPEPTSTPEVVQPVEPETASTPEVISPPAEQPAEEPVAPPAETPAEPAVQPTDAAIPEIPPPADSDAPSTGEVLGISGFWYMRDLHEGMSGLDVKMLQKELISEKYLAAEATGYFGAKTKAAVIKFQKAHGISPANGIVGQLTRNILNN